jgi:pyruvate dehydrogenase E1 component alpha subunit
MSSAEVLERREAVRTDAVARYERMVEIRVFEDRVKELFAEGLVRGTTHTAQGQEAVALGIASVLEPSDHVVCTYRGHHHALALGLTPETVMAEIMGRRGGSMNGLGGSMHLSDPAVGLLPTMAIVGAGIPIAAGAALTEQVRGTGAVAVGVFGDGAANIGAFHEGLNLASVWRLPVVFICENNLYGEYTPIAVSTSVTDIASRAASYDMPGVVVDGQDLDVVSAAIETAVARARDGDGPSLLEMKTYRYSGHSRADLATYRPAGELEEWQQRDPIQIHRERLEAQGLVEPGRDAELHDLLRARMDELAAMLIEAPAPDRTDMFRNVYA